MRGQLRGFHQVFAGAVRIKGRYRPVEAFVAFAEVFAQLPTGGLQK